MQCLKMAPISLNLRLGERESEGQGGSSHQTGKAFFQGSVREAKLSDEQE